jgi:hypothetical protein
MEPGDGLFDLQVGTHQIAPRLLSVTVLGGLRHGFDRGDAFPSSTIYDGAFTSSAEADAHPRLGQR